MTKGILVTSILIAVWLTQVSFIAIAGQAFDATKKADMLFVQNAKDATVDGGKIILKGSAACCFLRIVEQIRISDNQQRILLSRGQPEYQ